jgi:hypothetical protein
MDTVNHLHTEGEAGVLNPNCDKVHNYLDGYPNWNFKKTVSKLQKGINPFLKKKTQDSSPNSRLLNIGRAEHD